MASPRPKSPRPVVGNKNDKEESFWDKIGTLGRKKRIKEGKQEIVITKSVTTNVGGMTFICAIRIW